MRRIILFGVLFLTGCSTAPVTGLMDCFSPSKSGSNPDYPAKPSDRESLPDTLPAPQIPAQDVPARKTPVGDRSARIGSVSELPPAVESTETRILPP